VKKRLRLGPAALPFSSVSSSPFAQILLTAVPSRADNQITNNYEIALNQWVVDALVAQILLVRADNQITNNYEIALNQWVVDVRHCARRVVACGVAAKGSRAGSRGSSGPAAREGAG
jgi:hypothetical protein